MDQESESGGGREFPMTISSVCVATDILLHALPTRFSLPVVIKVFHKNL
ncbi:unnamed protein product [Haemonchus placei]|uniref:Uncharacterized protein n=1 Tax=Haemonchus placei TaxID=6290 RepID=A0A3P7XXB2_HAEPC|nr:unnamed protein product [Haemonchus placei]